MIYTITLNPALDRILEAPGFLPGNSCRVLSESFSAGGKGINVSRALKRLETENHALFLSGGETGEILIKKLRQEEIAHTAFSTLGETRINLKIFDPAAGQTTELDQKGPKVGLKALQELKERLFSLLKKGDTAAFCGSLPEDLPEDTYAELIEMARKKGARTVLDSSGEGLKQGLLAKPDLVKPNVSEMEYLYKGPLCSMVDLLMAARKLVRNGVDTVLLSMGQRGALLVREDKQLYGRPPKVESLFSVGAGDAMLAAALYSLEQGFEAETLLKNALCASALSVCERGCSDFDRERMEAVLPTVEIQKL